MKNKNGFIQTTLIVVGALVLLKYAYNIDVVGFLTEGKPKELLGQLFDLAVKSWNYLADLTKNLADKIK